MRMKLNAFRRDHSARSKNDGPGDRVLKFPNIARPLVGHDFLERILTQGDRTLGATEEALHQEGNVLLSLPQRRQSDGYHTQAVVEIFAEASGCNFAIQVVSRGSDQAKVNRDRRVASQTFDYALLNCAQQLCLQAKRKLGTLVKEESACLRLFKPADSTRQGAGKGSLLVPEKLRFQQTVRNGSAVDLDERPLGTGTVLMDRICHQLFSRTRFAGDQDGGIGRGDPPNQLVHVLHRQAVADDVRNVRRLGGICVQVAKRLFERAVFQGALDLFAGQMSDVQSNSPSGFTEGVCFGFGHEN